MFIGEAPGRLGADTSGIPFHGDKAGHNFEDLLGSAGISRAEVFVTNAVLCNPKDETGNNAAPNPLELENCSEHLRQQIDIVNPKIIVSLGAHALKALSSIESHELTLIKSVRTANQWYGRTLIPLYHPGQRAMIHRSFEIQRSDYEFVAERLAEHGYRTSQSQGESVLNTASIADIIIATFPSLSYFALHKLFYLLECRYATEYGRRLSRAFFIRQKDGPYCVDLHPRKLQKALPYVEVKTSGAKVLVKASHADLFGKERIEREAIPDPMKKEILKILSQYQGLKDSELKTKAYLTTPMRRIQRQEKRAGSKLYNVPIELS
jgi:uracil-DNA glycosylase family 4